MNGFFFFCFQIIFALFNVLLKFEWQRLSENKNNTGACSAIFLKIITGYKLVNKCHKVNIFKYPFKMDIKSSER